MQANDSLPAVIFIYNFIRQMAEMMQTTIIKHFFIFFYLNNCFSIGLRFPTYFVKKNVQEIKELLSRNLRCRRYHHQ